MKDYETMVVLQPQYTEEEVAAFIQRITEIINNNGGELESVEEWGVRTLAYKINNEFTEGYYILINFKAEPSSETGETVLEALEHYYKITDGIIRSIIVKRD